MKKNIRVAVAATLLGLGGAMMVSEISDLSAVFWIGACTVILATVWLVWEYVTRGVPEPPQSAVWEIGEVGDIDFEDHKYIGGRSYLRARKTGQIRAKSMDVVSRGDREPK